MLELHCIPFATDYNYKALQCFHPSYPLNSLSGDGAEKPDLATILQSIGKECAPKWYDLGLQLGVPDTTLHIIEKDCPNNCNDAIRKMIQEWLQQCSKPTWRTIIVSLRKIHMDSLASDVKRKYCVM